MKYGQIAENPSINECIYECFQHVDEADAERFVANFRTQPHDKEQVLHTYRELVLGSYLARKGYRVRAFQKYGGKEPDWSMLGEAGDLVALIDVVNFHADQQTERYIHAAHAAGKVAAPERNDAENSRRFYQKVQNKCTVYTELIEAQNVPYVIGFYPLFDASIDPSQIVECLYSEETGLFRKGEDGGYVNVSGLVHYADVAVADSNVSAAHIYRFAYYPNYFAARPFKFPVGEYYPPMLISSADKYRELVKVTVILHMLHMQILSMMGRDDDGGPSFRLWMM